MVAKIEQPSLKDDFYTSVNYEDLVVNNPGMLDNSDSLVLNQFEQAFDASSGVGNSKTFNRARDLMITGQCDLVHDYLTNLDIESYLSSKDLFSSLHSYFQIEKGSASKYYVSFVDGYINGETTIATMSLGGDAIAHDKDLIVDRLFDAYDMHYTNDDIDVLNSFDEETVYTAYQSYASNNGNKWKTFSFNNTKTNMLDSALRDYGLSESDTIMISTPTIDVISVLKTYSNATLKMGLVERLAFDYRFYSSAACYREISQYINDTGWFDTEKNISSTTDERASLYMVRTAFPALAERAYLEVAGNEEQKQQISSIIEQIIVGYKATADTYNWLDETTKAGLLRKLDYMEYESCYSDKIKNYPLMDETGIESASLLDISARYVAWYQNLVDNKLLETNVLWSYMPSYTVNAFYMPTMNSFVILNGILSCIPENGSIEEVLGTMGVIIGHEISHSIDSTGSQFDENGNYRNWWSSDCRDAFNSKVIRMRKFYNQINLLDNTYVDGNNVNGEATADMGGVHIALNIAKTIDGFDYDKFFKTYARLWGGKAVTQAKLADRIKNEHPFNYLRVNATLAQFDEFFETYDIGPGDRMYIRPDQRVAIW